MRVPASFIYIALTAILLFICNSTTAQSYLNFSKYGGGSNYESAVDFKVVNGETYTIGFTSSPDYPVTNGSTYGGMQDIVLTKYGANGNMLYATYIGSKGNDAVVSMDVINSEVYVLAHVDSSGLAVTNGSSHQGGRDVAFIKVNATGNIAVCTYLGGNQAESAAFNGLQVNGNTAYITGTTASQNLPVTEGGPYKGGVGDGFVATINTNNGNILQCKYIGGNGYDNVIGNLLDNGEFYITGTTTSSDLPVSTGSSSTSTYNQVMVYKLNAGDLSMQYCRELGGTYSESPVLPQVQNGILFLFGYTTSFDFPVTNGSASVQVPNPVGNYDCFFTKLNTDGSTGYSTYLSTQYNDLPFKLYIVGNETYIQCYTFNFTSGGTPGKLISFYKINGNGTFAYSKHIDIGLTSNGTVPVATDIVNGEVYFAGNTTNANFPVTNNSQYYIDGTGFFTKLDAAGNISYSTFLAKGGDVNVNMNVFNNKVYLTRVGTNQYPSTDGSINKGRTDNLLIVLKSDGSLDFSSYIGGDDDDIAYDMKTDASGVYLFGSTMSPDYPVTSNDHLRGSQDMFLTKISFCPATYDIAGDTLSPGIQTTCKNGQAQKLTGKQITSTTPFPTVYRNGIGEAQDNFVVYYQWQKANTAAGPWTDIPGENLKDYTPVVSGITQYYRRLAFVSSFCDSSILHTSDTAVVMVNNFTAPVINAGGTFNTCPSSPVTLGGVPIASGGTPPYISYQWDMGAAATANPVVAPNVNTIYTVVVTDNAGCKQIGQAVVLTYSATADAGPDKRNCAGKPVQIGGPAVTDVPGIAYNWQPATSLDNNSIAQPFANPAAATDYILTLTFLKTGGGTCDTKDTVTVMPVLPPTQANFAGQDKVACLGDIVPIGTTAETGFNYIWSPGFYLTSNITANTIYYPGNLFMPVPNPAFINLTAIKNGCSFFDMVEVAMIESRAGTIRCGPGLIGTPDRTPGIQETYQWTKLSGPGNFTGAVNLPQVPVSASVGGNTVYGLTVSYNGHSCYSEVTVPEVCNCGLGIRVDAKYKCPSYGVNIGDVTLIAYHLLEGGVTYSWSPQEGLDNYNSAVVKLTDNIPRLYTVTIVSLLDSNIRQSASIMVNDPAASIPVFDAPDTAVCRSIATAIGLPTVAGYSYLWAGNGLSNRFISNPLATIINPATYTVKVTETTGCEITDTVVVRVESVQANAGPDRIVCNNGVITLGTPALPNTTYHWEPQASPWQNGTNQDTAQPQVLVATNLTFTVTATTPLGCSATDQLNIVVNNSPTINDYPSMTICKGTGIRIGSAALAGVTYQWTPATGLSDATIAQPIANPSASTTYTLVATFPGNCSAPATDEVIITVSDPSFSMADINYCPSNGALALGTGAPAGMALYEWSPSYLVSNLSIANPSTLNPPPNMVTDFYLSVINADGCIYTDTIVLSPSISAPQAGNDKIVCQGNTAVIGNAANTTGPGITYNWAPATGLSNSSSINPVFTASTPGVFMYIITKTQNSCTSRDTVIITVPGQLINAITAPVVCENTCVQIGITPAEGLQYRWSPATGLSNVFIVNPIACVGTENAIYTLTATDVNGCSTQQNVVVGVNNLPAPQINIPAVTACVGDTGIRFDPQITPAGSYSYLWSPNDGSLNDITTLNPVIRLGGTSLKQYSLQVTNNTSGCTNSATGFVTTDVCPLVCTLGDYLWFDNNSNGLQDPTEIGVSGMLIKLYNSAGVNVATAITDANGFYSFTNVQPDTGYYVMFSKPVGYNFTLQNVGGTVSVVNNKANNLGRSNNFSIPASATILNIDAGIVPTGATPVMLLSFTGTLQNNKTILLNWQTTAEYNNNYFDVERSNDGIAFFVIERVKGNGTTSLPHGYSLIDAKPMNGTNYYRLKQVDIDGHYTYSNIVLIKVNSSPLISAFYNNQSNSIQVKFNIEQSKTQLKLFAANGQLVKAASVKNSNNYLLELPALAGGVYLLQVLTDKNIYTEKIFINR